MAFVALFLAAKFLVYTGFFYAISLALNMGVPLDSLRAGFHRTWLGASVTLVSLVIFMFLRLGGTSAEMTQDVVSVSIWILRAGVWIWVATWVYRVTRWRKGKLALVVLLGLALNFGIDVGLLRLQGSGSAFMPSFGDWQFRLC